MAHNIANINGKDAVFTGMDEAPWHKLGTTIKGLATWQEAMALAQLNWLVKKERLFDQRGKELAAWGIFRDIDGQFLGTVGDRYEIIQNHQAFAFIDDLIGIEGAHYDSAGALKNGEIIFCSAHLPSAGFEIVDGDKHQVYLMFKGSHDGSLSNVAKLTDVRVVCNNTLSAALAGNGSEVRIKHTKNAIDRMEMAKRLVASGTKTAQQLRDKMQTLARKQMTREGLEDILKKLFPFDKEGNVHVKSANNIRDLLSLFESCDKGALPEIKGTAYNFLNAVTEYVDHVRAPRAKGQDVAAARTASAVFGSGETFKAQAFEYVYAMAKKLPDMPKAKHFDQAPLGGFETKREAGYNVVTPIVADNSAELSPAPEVKDEPLEYKVLKACVSCASLDVTCFPTKEQYLNAANCSEFRYK